MDTSQRDNRIELVRALAIEIGIRPAARRLGVNEDTACVWAKRYGWDIKGAKPGPENSVSKLQANPIDVLADELAENKRETKLSLSRYARRAAKDSESLSVRESPLVHKVAQVAGLVWPEDQAQSEKFTLNVLNMGSLEVSVGDSERLSDPGVSE